MNEQKAPIGAIKLKQKSNFNLVNGKEDAISPLSKINLFVGENNSGKSRFLRSLAIGKLTFEPHPSEIKDVNEIIGAVKRLVASILRNGMIDANHIWEQAGKLEPVTFVSEEINYLNTLKELLHNIAKLKN